MLSTLPIYLAQLKAGNNCEKLKNEIRQKILKNNSIKVCLTLSKSWKQSL